MKIVCDVCSKEEALVFCCADEAGLCGACDRRVHHANKLAGKHRRFSLSSPTPQSHPLCDICQEKRGFLFCQEDRAILCRDCDAPIHSANHLTMKHNRFILTGVRLSAAPISSSDTGEPEATTTEKAKTSPAVAATNQNKALVAATRTASAAKASAGTTATATAKSGALASTGGSISQKRNFVPENTFTKGNDNTNTPASSVSAISGAATSCAANDSASSISEYLMKTCPGWHVEDLLVDDAAPTGVFYKVDELPPFVETGLDGDGLEAVAVELPQVWVPHVPQFPATSTPTPAAAGSGAGATHYQAWTAAAGKEVGMAYHQMEAAAADQWGEDAFLVPQISPVSASSKRPRHSVWYH